MDDKIYSRTWPFGENIHSVAFADDGTAGFALVDGTVVLVQDEQEERHSLGSTLSFAATRDGFVHGGDDGRVTRLVRNKEPEVLATHKGKWIDHVATHPDGHIAYATGKDAFILGRDTPLSHPGSIGGLAFDPNGKRLAASHYNGVSLWWLKSKESKPQVLNWKGSHLGLLWHPSGTHLMTSMQENALHGWRMKDLSELRMAGYPGKVHSMGFSAKGKWLATSGGEQIICWPFTGGGPQGKPPFALGMPESRPCTVVAPHPKEELVAAGYGTGRVVLAIFEDRLPIEILPPDNVPVTALAWSPDGMRLLAGREDGSAFLFTAEAILNTHQADF